jgi:hypothetical protein
MNAVAVLVFERGDTFYLTTFNDAQLIEEILLIVE